MPRDEEDDLYDEEFDFVDEDDDDIDEASDIEDGEVEDSEVDDSEVEEDVLDGVEGEIGDDEGAEPGDDEAVDDFGRAKPAPDHVVHIYEHQKLKRTIDRPFTAEDAEAFASEYNRTSKSYGRFAIAGKTDAKPKKSLD